MAKRKLTEEMVRKLRPTGKAVDYFDKTTPRLILRLSPQGTKAWRALYYVKVGDKTVARSHGLGRYPALGLKAAREAAKEFLANPKATLSKSEAGTFRKVAEEFVRRHVDANKLRSKREIERVLRVYVYPKWEHRLFLDIRRGDVTALIDGIEDKNGPRQADMTLAIVRKMFRWYQARHDDYTAPVVPGMGRTKPADRKRKRILTDDELRALWKAVDDMPVYGPLLKVAVLTAQREGKVRTMKHADIIDGVWHIPAEAREKSTAGHLALPQVVLDIIEAQPKVDGNPHVFVGKGKTAFNSFSQRKAELDKRMPAGMEPWIVHDLRRTARSLMSRAGVRPDIAERVLGHAIAGVEGVYDRHAYEQEKGDALEKLAALVMTIINPPEGDNVVPLMKRTRSKVPA